MIILIDKDFCFNDLQDVDAQLFDRLKLLMVNPIGEEGFVFRLVYLYFIVFEILKHT